MMKKKQKNILIAFVVIFGIILVLGLSGKLNTLAIPSGSQVKLAIPNFASFKCEVIEDKNGILINVPKSGVLLSKSTVGFYTSGINNVQTEITQSVWSFWAGFPLRLRYNICDSNGNICGSDFTYIYITPGKRGGDIRSIDFSRESIRIYFDRGYGALGLYYWDAVDGGKVYYDSKAFGLRLYATTQDPAGKKICTTSCNLDCPDIGIRQKIVLDCLGNEECERKGDTGLTTVGFYDTAPYLEYWNTIDYDLNQQGGATIFNSNTNQFCFAGTIYNSKTIKLESGVTYVYPDTNTRQNKQCCPGARIASTYSDLVCQNDYTWKVIQDTDQLTCFSDINCPGVGNNVCQNKQVAGYSCVNKDSNNIGICQKSTGRAVQCCSSSDCNRDMVCDTSDYTCKGGTIYPVCGDWKLDAGEQCDDGNTVGGDGCSSICQNERVQTCGDKILQQPEQCDDGNTLDGDGCSSTCKNEELTCKTCDDYVLSKVLGSVSNKYQCTAKTGTYTGAIIFKLINLILPGEPLDDSFPQNGTTCAVSYIKLGMSVLVILIGTLVLGSALSRKKLIKNKAIGFLIALVVSGIISYLTFISFIVGLIYLIGIIIYSTAGK